MLNKLFNKRIKNEKAKQLMVRHVITLSPTENLWKDAKHNVKIQNKESCCDSK